MLTIQLPQETEALLQERATKAGVDLATYTQQIVEDAARRIALDPTIALFEKWDREDATDDPAEIVRREKEVREFMEGMNRNRLEMEGPNARLIYP